MAGGGGRARSSRAIAAEPRIRGVRRLLQGDPDALLAKLELLRPLHGAERIDAWKAHLAHGDWDALVADLLESHYDPAYRRSLTRNYRDAQTATPVDVRDASRGGFLALARALARSHG